MTVSVRRLLFGLLLALLGLELGGCSTTDQKADDPNRVSTIPWNRPEQWEGQGSFGGMSPGTR